MCLIVFAWQQHPDIPLLLAANRDEFHERPASAASYWDDTPEVLAGRDLQAGGTWLGVSRSGRFAAITNIRDPDARTSRAPRSRGELTHNFLRGKDSAQSYLSSVAKTVGEYQGFNLLIGDKTSLWYLHGSSTQKAVPTALTPGIYGLSNAALDIPWPKVALARVKLQRELQCKEGPNHQQLRDCLSDRTLANSAALEQHKLSGEMARQLSAQFIVTERYGTRCSTTLRQHRNGLVEFQEQRFGPAGELLGTSEFELATAPAA